MLSSCLCVENLGFIFEREVSQRETALAVAPQDSSSPPHGEQKALSGRLWA